MSNRTYSIYQAARELDLSVYRVQTLIDNGLLKARKECNRWIIPAEEIENFSLKERTGNLSNKKASYGGRSFDSDPSEQYLLAFDTIGSLLDQEGLDSAQRAFSQAAYFEIQSQAMEGYTPQRGAHVCLYRLLGAKSCPDTRARPCDSPRLPGSDHISEWVKDGKTAKIVSQPYRLSYDDLKELIAFCEAKGLKAEISAQSWHFPGRTLRVDFSLAKDPTLGDQ
jgi:hypothetical protein